MKIYKPFTQSEYYSILGHVLTQLPPISELVSTDRAQSCIMSHDLLTYYYAATRVNTDVLELFQLLSDDLQLTDQYHRVLFGGVMNRSEDRAVSHHQTRSDSDRGWYGEEWRRIKTRMDAIRKEGRFTHILHIGIGGSDLGPRSVYEALRRYVVATGGHLIEMTFVSNLDSDDLLDGIRDLDLTQTLVVVVSKSGATLETSMNSELLSDVAFQQGISYEALDAQTIVVTSKDSVLDVAGRFMDIFYIDDAIGGRFSLTSAVGAVGLSCAFGSAIFDRFLFGASELDRYAEQPFIESNMVMLNAWIGVCDRHFFGASSKAVVAYAEGLSHFVSHLQQLDCESNGKSVNRQGQKVSYPTGPMVWGGVGSSVQHSFFQWLHQAGNESSIQLIGCRRPQLPGYTSAYSHQRLIQNMVAQWMAFSRGEACPEDANRHFEGNRSVSVVMMDQLTPETCGALVSFYENTIMFQGFIWDINSFDQEGVQLGKRLSTQLDDGSADDRLNALYHSLLY